MPLVSFPRSTPTLLQLEDRCTPAIEVWNTNWDAGKEKSLPWAIAQANNQAGQDTITFNWIELGNRPTFRALAGETVNVTEGVIINAGGGGQYATFTGFWPFSFTHDAKGAAGAGLESAINGGVFDGCGVPVGNNFSFDDCGGAIQVMNGTLTVANTRFTGNTAFSGGAIAVDTGAKLVVRGLPNVNPPLPGPGEPFIPELLETRTLCKGNGAVAAGRGGAIWSLGEVDLADVWFVGNSANDGGAIAITGSGKLTDPAPVPPGPMPIGSPGPIVYDVRFYENTARADGGAVFYRSSNQTSVLDHVAFGSNTSAARGGGIAVLEGHAITHGIDFRGEPGHRVRPERGGHSHRRDAELEREGGGDAGQVRQQQRLGRVRRVHLLLGRVPVPRVRLQQQQHDLDRPNAGRARAAAQPARHIHPRPERPRHQHDVVQVAHPKSP